MKVKCDSDKVCFLDKKLLLKWQTAMLHEMAIRKKKTFETDREAKNMCHYPVMGYQNMSNTE